MFDSDCLILFSQPFAVGFLPGPVTDSGRSPGAAFKLAETLESLSRWVTLLHSVSDYSVTDFNFT